MWFKQFKVRTALTAIFALLPAAGIAQSYLVRPIIPVASKGYGDIHISKATVPGQRVRIWWATLLNSDCTAAGTMTTQFLSKPRHGQADISSDQLYPNFVAPNPRAACDDRKVPGNQAFYTPDSGFRGHDKVVLQNATSEGRMRRVTVDIDVR